MCTEADNSLAMYALGFFDDDDGAVIVHFAPAESAGSRHRRRPL